MTWMGAVAYCQIGWMAARFVTHTGLLDEFQPMWRGFIGGTIATVVATLFYFLARGVTR